MPSLNFFSVRWTEQIIKDSTLLFDIACIVYKPWTTEKLISDHFNLTKKSKM
jgi:hypothetical protein